ncbi:ras guanine nucleotide exchange factor domain-containing protein [Mycena floridula]|nr:ras guanine nucleotide exchange factor domain-containing protein [Mycena floridula]
MYRSQQQSYQASASRSQSYATTSVQQMPQSVQQEQEPPDDFPVLFCRALYDYEAQDASALSFRRDDIIEILTQQASGWWDGLLGEERGWFPSNYVTLISEEEADLALSGSDRSNTEAVQLGNSQIRPQSIVDMSHAMSRGIQEENEEWLDNELSNSRNGLDDLVQASWQQNGTSSSDFWMPQVAPNGQIFYVNTQTGQQSRDLPLETEDEVSDTDVAGLTSQSSSRSGTSAGLGLAASDNEGPGFGLRPDDAPEPWIRKLADDGMSFYYYNKADGTVQWTRPEPSSSQKSSPPRETSRLPVGQSNGARLSVYSDSSDVQPADVDPVRSLLNGHVAHTRPRRSSFSDENVVMQLTSAELIAQSLQQAIQPPTPELLPDLSAAAKGSIQAVIDNIQIYSGAQRPDQDQKMDDLIYSVVLAVRNLLYVSAVPSGQIPQHLIPKQAQGIQPSHPSQSPLKPAQRKVTATLSRLVLSARAMQYDSGSSLSETLNRIEVDAEELERAVLSFVLDVQRAQHNAVPDSPEYRPLKRLYGVFMTTNIGLGLVGAGAGAGWKGFGWVSLDDEEDVPRRLLGPEVVTEAGSYVAQLDSIFASLGAAARAPDATPAKQVRLRAKELVSRISNFLTFVANIHVARHVDIDGIRQESSPVPNDRYSQTVEKARTFVRGLETASQAVYDDAASLLLAAQAMREADLGQSRQDRAVAYDYMDILSTSLKANVAVVQQSLEALLTIGHDQADMAQGDYNGSIEWRMSRLSVIDTKFGGLNRPNSNYNGFDENDEDFVDFEHALSRPAIATRPGDRYDSIPYRHTTNGSQSTSHKKNVSSTVEFQSMAEDTLVGHESPLLDGEADNDYNDDAVSTKRSTKTQRGTDKAGKLRKLMGDEIPESYLAWYLRPNYDQTEVLIDPDGSVRAGTIPALVEQLTAHDHADRNFIEAFLMTYKSFTSLDDLFDLLVQRFWIQPPPKLTPSEREQWGKLKQHVIRTRVLNIFKSMVVEEDILEKEDLYILDRMKEFITTDEVYTYPAAKQLLLLIERAQKGGEKVVITTTPSAAPAPIIPKGKAKLKLIDIEPLELARQLTLFESQLYQKIRPTECLQRAREQKSENNDNITVVIQTSNRIANWVAESVLSKDDSRRRAAAVKHLISVADRCRTLNNFSTMIAITSGLNTPPIRRLKRTWEQVSQRYMAQFGACEMTIDSNRNFNKYRSLMATVNPPCVPFIGVFLSTLQFIQDGNPDNLAGGLVNFKKRQMASEVIIDIKRWQAQSFNFVSIANVQQYIEESLSQYNDSKATSEHFWQLSLDREPREREDEKMARLLQESGFL